MEYFVNMCVYVVLWLYLYIGPSIREQDKVSTAF